jgi:pSer/pThr/pTyr-binding forkhead associated (FHA) protein
MFVLEVTNGPRKGQALGLRFGLQIIIGRGRGAQLLFDDEAVSARHAQVDWDDQGFGLTDLGSRNGTFLNGHRVEGRSGLKVGDILQVGAHLLQLKESEADFVAEPTQLGEAPVKILAFTTIATKVIPKQILHPSALPPAGPNGGMLALGPQATMMTAGPAEYRVDAGDVSLTAELARRLGSDASLRVLVHVAGRFDPFATLPVSIGREHGNEIALEDPALSLKHAVIDHRDAAFVVRDLGSSNGTFVNGARVVIQKLSNGDVIGIGGHTLLVVTSGAGLGLVVSAPSATAPEGTARDAQSLGVINAPLAAAPRKKRRARDLVWFATSDLDRGVYRARSALIALFVAVAATTWMLADGDSETLAGGRLMTPHESESFLVQAEARGVGRCSSCHVGLGRISAVKCFDCHEDSRPTEGHVKAELLCQDCHQDHQGTDFRAAGWAALDCKRCHQRPHEVLVRTQPQLVASFRPDAEATVDFHLLHHVDEKIGCTSCHGELSLTERGVRGSCGQCHAPDEVAPTDCHQCHRAHPEQDRPIHFASAAPTEPPRFAYRALAYVGVLIFGPFLLAGLIPRRRKVSLTEPES